MLREALGGWLEPAEDTGPAVEGRDRPRPESLTTALRPFGSAQDRQAQEPLFAGLVVRAANPGNASKSPRINASFFWLQTNSITAGNVFLEQQRKTK